MNVLNVLCHCRIFVRNMVLLSQKWTFWECPKGRQMVWSGLGNTLKHQIWVRFSCHNLQNLRGSGGTGTSHTYPCSTPPWPPADTATDGTSSCAGLTGEHRRFLQESSASPPAFHHPVFTFPMTRRSRARGWAWASSKPRAATFSLRT